MEKPISLPFSPKPSTLLHIDLNSCFASVEQQANPLLRGKPVAVAAYTSPSGCILAPSVEAKQFGVKTGMRVKDGKLLCPSLIVLPSDPNKYRSIHLKLRNLLNTYTDKVTPKSIDEFVLNFEGSPSFVRGMFTIAREIKARIKSEVGDWLRVSIGIAPNRFLAKTAAGLHKPDGLDEINESNYLSVYSSLALSDLCGIKRANVTRLNNNGIFTLHQFYQAEVPLLKSAFGSINGYYWYLRLRGYEIDDVIFARRSYGNSYSIPQPISSLPDLSPILQKLVEKASFRMRTANYWARGVHVGILYRNGSFWHHGSVQSLPLFDPRDIYKAALKTLSSSPYHYPVHTLSVSCFDLFPAGYQQLTLFEGIDRKVALAKAIDSVNSRWGNFVITPARMLAARSGVPDRIAFGGIKELEEIVLSV